MASSAHFVDRNWDELRDHAAAYLQIDQPACAGTWRWGSHSTVELRRCSTRWRPPCSAIGPAPGGVPPKSATR